MLSTPPNANAQSSASPFDERPLPADTLRALLAINALEPAALEALDQALVAACAPAYRKVARVVGEGLAMSALPASVAEEALRLRVDSLCFRGRLVSAGDLSMMRRSEVRLAGPEPCNASAGSIQLAGILSKNGVSLEPFQP